MKKSLIVSFLCAIGVVSPIFAQVNISTAKANPKTFIFDDNKHTVHGYIYNALKEKSACCGNDAIYLKVSYDASGNTTDAQTLTGKNNCYKKSVVDIVKNIRWKAGNEGAKTVFFEVKPVVPCSGSPGENEYKPIPLEGGATVAINEPNIENDESSSEGSEEDDNWGTWSTEEGETDEAQNPPSEEGGFLSDGGFNEEESQEEVSTTVVEETSETEAAWETEEVVGEIAMAEEVPQTVNTTGGGYPMQADIPYESRGELSPDASHQDTHENLTISQPGRPIYQGGNSKVALAIKKKLKESGHCGLVQAAVEVTIDKSGSIISSRVLYANVEKIREILPQAVSSVSFQPLTGRLQRQYAYIQFKTVLRCEGQEQDIDLKKVPNIIKTVSTEN